VAQHDWLTVNQNFCQIVEPGEFLFHLASLFVVISGHGEDLLTSNPATVFENPGFDLAITPWCHQSTGFA
jgi:hypothetical protein